MFTSHGIGLIAPGAEITMRPYSNGQYFSFPMITKDPYIEDGKQWVRISVQVPHKDVEEAVKTFKPMKGLYIRLSEVKGFKTEKGSIIMNIDTKWRWVEPLSQMPTKERKTEE